MTRFRISFKMDKICAFLFFLQRFEPIHNSPVNLSSSAGGGSNIADMWQSPNSAAGAGPDQTNTNSTQNLPLILLKREDISWSWRWSNKTNSTKREILNHLIKQISIQWNETFKPSNGENKKIGENLVSLFFQTLLRIEGGQTMEMDKWNQFCKIDFNSE